MKVEMSSKDIESRLQLVGQMFELSLMLRRAYLQSNPDAPKTGREKFAEKIISEIENKSCDTGLEQFTARRSVTK